MVYYWVAWFLWVLTTFFVKKTSKYRFGVSFCLLLLISVTPFEITLLGYQFNLAVVFLYIIILLHLVKRKMRLSFYTIFCSYILMLAYASFLLFELYDPVWLLFSRSWMVACLLGYLSVMLLSDKEERLMIMICAMIQGEWIFSMVVEKIGFSYTIGTGQFLDTLATSVLVLVLCGICESIIVILDQFMNQHVRGKQKST